jgi:hypothetical protein
MTDGDIVTDEALFRIEHKLRNPQTTLGRVLVCVVFATIVLINNWYLELSLNETGSLVGSLARKIPAMMRDRY